MVHFRYMTLATNTIDLREAMLVLFEPRQAPNDCATQCIRTFVEAILKKCVFSPSIDLFATRYTHAQGMCIYIYIHLCVYIHIYIYIYVYTHTCVAWGSASGVRRGLGTLGTRRKGIPLCLRQTSIAAITSKHYTQHYYNIDVLLL